MFLGFVSEGEDETLLVQLRTSAGAPVEADAAPTFRVYGQNANLVAGGSGSLSLAETGSVTNASNASPIVITAADSNVSTGQAVKISGVTGNTAANGTFLATAINANSFSLQGSTGNGAYVSGGTWRTRRTASWSPGSRAGCNGH
jgi:hypothetical protein